METNNYNFKRLTKGFALLAALLLGGATAMAQDFYVIKAGDNFLAHNTTLDGGITNATSFSATTCLWTISGSNIIAIGPDGTTGYYLAYRSGNTYTLNLRNDGSYIAWSSGISDGGEPYYSNYGTPYYLRYRSSAWGVSNNNTHGVLTKLTVSDAPNTSGSSSTDYTATVSGDNVIYSTSGTHTYTATVDQVITYAQTRRTFSGYANSGTTEAIIDKPYPVSSTYSTPTGVTWGVSENSYGATIPGGVLSITSLPTLVDYITVTYTATAGGETVTATKHVTLTKDQATAEGRVGQSTGVSTDTVTLNDYEDHSWSYYSDASLPQKFRSLNPANVKITYNGNGTGTVQTNNNDAPSTWGADATTVKVGIDANASTFVYYETLERTNGRTAASVDAATGRCAYTTIANPFSVRPTYDSDGTSKYRGFYAWRVKKYSGGKIYTASTGDDSIKVGGTINAETKIYFAPTSEYGMTVELEALWARAYVSTSGAPNKSLGVERNFYVITASATSDITASTNPCTYTSIYPNGTTNGTTPATSVTVYKYGGFTASADSKIEYIILRNNSSTINAAGKNFTIGRGVSGYSGGLCADNLYGLSGNSTTSFKFNFASGKFANLYFCGSGRTMSSGILTSVIGCDYDRAMGDNDNLKITSDIIAGYNGAGGSNNHEGEDFLHCTVKSGDFDLGSYGGGSQFYLSLWGNTGSGTYGKKTMIVEGGVFSDISGGIDVEDNEVSAADMLEIRVKGGTVNGALYGAAQYSSAYGNRYIIITGGEMKGWVAGGANGTRVTGGKLTGDTYVYFGGRARCDSEGSNAGMGSGKATGGNIFGAGSGHSDAASDAIVGEVNNSTIVIADECYVERNVYGGGNYGAVSTGTGHKSDIHILGGTVNGSVFGGSNNQKGQIVNVYMTDGQINTSIYGGSNASGAVLGPVNIHVDGGTVGDGGDGDGVYGGGYGSSTSITGNVIVTLGASTSATNAATVNGNVYGGSALGSTNSGNANNTTAVTVNKGTVNGNVFGGAYGNGAVVNGLITVTVNGGSITGGVYGGGDAAAYSKSGQNYPVVNMTGGTAGNVFGGGKGGTATVTGNPQVTLSGTANVTGNVYGGGDAATVSGSTNVILKD